jgi:hypothetical protein
MTDFPRTRAFVNGVIIGVSLSIFSFFAYTLKPNSQPMPPKSTFEVIDTYKGCDVVQYTNEYLSHYNYFLDCKK